MITNQMLVFGASMLYILFPILGVVGIVVFIAGYEGMRRAGVPISRRERWRWGVVVALSLAAFTPCFLIKTVRGSLVLVESDQIIQVFPEDTVMSRRTWRKLVEGRDASLVDYSFTRYAGVDMIVHPITENPKVRSLNMRIKVQTIKTPEGCVKFRKFASTSGIKRHDNNWFGTYVPLQDHVTSLLYEFNEAHSRDLAVFYNPLDPKQQEKFAVLVRSFLEPKLNEVGAVVSSARFDMEN